VPDSGAVSLDEPGAGQSSGTFAGLADGAGAASEAGTAGAARAAEGILWQLEALIRDNLVYPPLARKRNIQGEVRISLLIGPDGALTGSTLVRGSGSSILDKAAIALVERLFPLDLGQRLGEPTSVIIRIVYSLTS
jgi:protein TonB